MTIQIDEKMIKEIHQNAKAYSEFVMNITGFNRPIIETAVSRTIVISLFISLKNTSILSFICTLILAFFIPFLIVIIKMIFGLIYTPALFFLLSLSKIPVKRNNYINIYSSIIRYLSIAIKTSCYFICIAFCYNFIFQNLFNLFKIDIDLNIQNILFYLMIILTLTI
ncbi:MAG: hypothetical protein RL208_329, partial [Pseudomonadota bacterium]